MNSLLPSASRRAAAPQSAISHPPSTIGGPAASVLRHPSSVLGRFAAFTLIELLVVISIIAILAGLAFPAVNGALNSARKAQARNDVQQIVAAVKAFQSEYGRMPTTDPAGTDPENEWGDTYYQGDNERVIRILVNAETGNQRINAKGIVFLDAKSTQNKKGGIDLTDFKFYDPWGIPYAIKLDNNYSGKVEYYNNGTPNIFNSSMAVSSGPDKQFGNPYAASGTGKDDICSFK
jgi:prepilin-type N-terminal cleavage/methylation domain-containing protein